MRLYVDWNDKIYRKLTERKGKERKGQERKGKEQTCISLRSQKDLNYKQKVNEKKKKFKNSAKSETEE